MNQQRRKRINEIISNLQLQSEELAIVMEEEQEAFDNMPESLQSGDKGQKMEEALFALQESIDSIESTISSLEECLGE